MQKIQIKEKLKSAIQIYKKTKNPRAAEVIEHLNKILSTSKSRDSLLHCAEHIYPVYKDPAQIKLISNNLEAIETN